MKFKDKAEAFNFYRDASLEELETRAKEIRAEVRSNDKVDMDAVNIELDGISEAKKNAEERAARTSSFDAKNLMRKAPESDDICSTPEYRSAFFKTLLNKPLTELETAAYKAAAAEKRADAFNTVTGSAAVIPTTTLNEVVKKARTMGGLLSVCRAFNMPSNLAIPVGTPSTKAAWHVEGATVAREKNEPASVNFSAYELIKIFSMSAASQKMSISAFESYLVDELNTCVMDAIADAVINGTGTAQGLGLETGITWSTSTNLIEYAKADSISYSDLTSAVATLKRGYANGAVWAMSNALLYRAIYGMTTTDGRPIFVQDPRTDNIGYILGFPVIVDDNIAYGTAYFGNFQYYGYNLPDGIALEVSRDSGFTSGLIDYRALAIADCKPIVPEAFVKLAKATA